MTEQKSEKYVDKNGDVMWKLPNGKLHRLDGPAVKWNNGDKWWFVDGKLHRLDGPAVEWTRGYKAWCVDGKRHRLDGPAIERSDGHKEWWVDGVEYTEADWKKKVKKMTKQKSERCVEKSGVVRWKLPSGKLHRLDGPAVEQPNGTKSWWVDGKLHRLDGPAVEYTDGNKEWYVDGKLHRLDGPAREWANGHKEWWVNGKRHRLDGPAVEWFDGTKEWWVDGVKYTEAEWKKKVEKMTKQKSERCVEKSGVVRWKLPSGKLHRLDGPAVEHKNYKAWYVDGKLHRLDGPAVEWADGEKWWFVNDERHRLDGPAVDWASGYKEWWIGGVKYIEADWKEKVGKMTEQKSKKYMNETKSPDIRNAKGIAEIDIDVIATLVISDFIKENKNLIYSGERPARVPFLRMNFERRKKIVSKFLDKLIAWGEAQS